MPKLYIKLGEVPRNVFVDDCITIPVFLVDGSDKLHPPIDAYNHLIVRCRVEGATYDSESGPEFLVEPGSNRIGPNGAGQLRLTFKTVSMNFENRKFVIHVSKQSPRDVVSAQTQPLFVISQQLVLTEEFSEAYTWYKDEGGKEKCIEYGVHMIDRFGNRVRGKKVALKVTLMYKNGQPVPQQNIMTLLPDSRMVLDERTGSTTLRVRINEVSTRHQGQLFQILVSPDITISPATADVCSVLSVPVDVKSKRNHHRDRERERDRENRESQNAAARPASLAMADSTGSNKRMKSDETSSGGSSTNLALSAGDTQASTSQPQPSVAISATAESSEAPLDSMQFNKPTDFDSALSNLVLWSKAVIRGMERIRWNQIGFNPKSDGSPDPTRPLYTMNNPNETVSSIMQEYTAYIQPSLYYLGGMSPSQHSLQQPQHLSFGDRYCPPDAAIACDAQLPLDDRMLAMMSMDMWAQDADELSVAPFVRGTPFKPSTADTHNPNMLSLTRNHSLFLDLHSTGNNNNNNSGMHSSNNAFDHAPPVVFTTDSNSGRLYTPRSSFAPELAGVTVPEAPSTSHLASGGGHHQRSALEDSVEHILVTPCKEKEFAVSCFDVNRQLIGFYKDSESSVTFVSTDDMLVTVFGLDAGNASAAATARAELQRTYTTALSAAMQETDSVCVFSKENYHNDVDKMREDALIQLIIKETHANCGFCPRCRMNSSFVVNGGADGGSGGKRVDAGARPVGGAVTVK